MKDTAVTTFRSGQLNVTTVPAMIPAALATALKGILIKAHGSGDAAANTVPVFISEVVAGTVTSGFSLAPGESVTVPVGSSVYVVTSANTQVVSWMLV